MNIEKIKAILEELLEERKRQHAKWGEQNWPDGTGDVLSQNIAEALKKTTQNKSITTTWRTILVEEVFEVFAESNPGRLREELIQVAAVAVQWIEAIDRRQEKNK